MKPARSKRNPACAMTLIEAIVTVAAFAFLIAVILPAAWKRPKRGHVSCANNVRQVAVGFRLYGNDGDPYPKFNPTNEAWTYFQVVGKEIGSPKVLICPQDMERSARAVSNFESPPQISSFAHPNLRNQALSFFYGTEGSPERADTLLVGDRNIYVSPRRSRKVLVLQTNSPVEWTEEIHQYSGNVALSDGSAQQVSAKQLREQLRKAEVESQTLVLP